MRHRFVETVGVDDERVVIRESCKLARELSRDLARSEFESARNQRNDMTPAIERSLDLATQPVVRLAALHERRRR
jgi:hypothetical protein